MVETQNDAYSKTYTWERKKETFFEKRKSITNFTIPNSNSFLNVSHQSKAFYNFHKNWQGPDAGCCFSLD